MKKICNQHHVPEEIVTDILLRLSVESLLRCRTVSKLWLSIISDHHFIKSHHLIAAHKTPCILINQTFCFTPQDFNFIFLPQIFTLYDLFISSCNGIVCLTDGSGGDIHLWNPSTKQYKTVPKPNKYPDLYGISYIGFGYDSTSDDYKILCVGFQGGRHDRERVQLFSTKSGCWREIVVNITLPRESFITSLAINGILYFEFDDTQLMVLSFNLYNEKFNIVPLPCPVNRVNKKASNLLEFEGSLAIITRDSDLEGFNVWTLDNTCEMSWIKKLTIELPLFEKFRVPELLIKLYLGNGQFFGSPYDYGSPYNYRYPTPPFDIMWCNYKTKEGNYFHSRCGVELPLVLKYTESLVSLQGFKSTEPIENQHSGNSSGCSQKGYEAQGALLSKQQGTGPYRGQMQQNSISQSQYAGYPPRTTSGGYATSWDQTFAKAPRTTLAGDYDYRSQQGQGYTQDAYCGYNVSTLQCGYPQPQPGHYQQYGYNSSTPGYGNIANPTILVLLNQQGQGYTHDAYGNYNAYVPQLGYALPQQGYPSINLPNYSVPSLSQTAYGTQPSSGYGPIYGAPQARKAAAGPPAYGQLPIPQMGYVQPGYPLLSNAGYCQPDCGTQRTPSSGYGVPVSGYAPPPTPYGAAAAQCATHPSYWGHQKPCNSSYGSGYFEPPVNNAGSIAAPTSQSFPPNSASKAPQS